MTKPGFQLSSPAAALPAASVGHFVIYTVEVLPGDSSRILNMATPTETSTIKTHAEMVEEINRVCTRGEPAPGTLQARSEELAVRAKEFAEQREEERRRRGWLGRVWAWLAGA
jgi:hypothetical protein